MKHQSRKRSPSDETLTIGAESEESLLAELRQSFGSTPDQVPDGWLTAEQWAQRWGYQRPYAHRLLAHGVQIGRWEWRKFRVPTETKRAYAVVHYRPKAKTT